MTFGNPSSASRSTLEVALTRALSHFVVPLTRYVADKPKLRARLRAIRRELLNRGRRLSGDPLSSARRVLDAVTPLREQALHWSLVADQSTRLAPAAIAAGLALCRRTKGVVISVSHDDYIKGFGGVQNVIADEQLAFQAGNWSYLHLSPAAPLPLLAPKRTPEEYRLRIRLNGQLLGVVAFPDLAAALAELHDIELKQWLVVHHLKGHVPELLAELAASAERKIVWVHDYFSLCPNFTLMRNNVRFCGAPATSSAACGVCVFGADRVAQLPRIRAFFAALTPIVVAPSEAARAFWSSRGHFAHTETLVVPPAILRMDNGFASVATKKARRPLRVAYLGASTLHKGWAVFSALASRYRRDPRYKFYQLGADGIRSRNYVHDPVHVRPDQRDAMIEAATRHRIDVAIAWSLWPETFCFTVHEALAAGAFVVARRAAGNVWLAVAANAPDQGMPVDNEAQLYELFESGDIVARVAQARRLRGRLIPTGNTADLLTRFESGTWGSTKMELAAP
jgi:hypothetical protein